MSKLLAVVGNWSSSDSKDGGERSTSCVVTGGMSKRRRRVRVSKYHGVGKLVSRKNRDLARKQGGHSLPSLLDYFVELDDFLFLQRGIISKFT